MEMWFYAAPVKPSFLRCTTTRLLKKVNSNYHKLLNRGGERSPPLSYPQSLAIFQESKYLSYKSSPFGLLYSLS